MVSCRASTVPPVTEKVTSANTCPCGTVTVMSQSGAAPHVTVYTPFSVVTGTGLPALSWAPKAVPSRMVTRPPVTVQFRPVIVSSAGWVADEAPEAAAEPDAADGAGSASDAAADEAPARDGASPGPTGRPLHSQATPSDSTATTLSTPMPSIRIVCFMVFLPFFSFLSIVHDFGVRRHIPVYL